MRYIVIPDFLARLEEASLEEARFEKGLRGKVKKALRAKRKADADNLAKSIEDRRSANRTTSYIGKDKFHSNSLNVYINRIKKKIREIKAAKKDRPKLP